MPSPRKSFFRACLLANILLLAVIGFPTGPAYPEEPLGDKAGVEGSAKQPPRFGMGMVYGKSFEPNGDIQFGMVSVFVQYPYGQIWRNAAPEQLRFKIELNMGSSIEPKGRFMTSANIMAVYYLDKYFSWKGIKPYGEAGIGVIYTDLRAKGQGLRWNFNPQAGVGMEFNIGSGPPFFTSFRLHHISNAGIDSENTGVNSFTFTFGRFF